MTTEERLAAVVEQLHRLALILELERIDRLGYETINYVGRDRVALRRRAILAELGWLA